MTTHRAARGREPVTLAQPVVMLDLPLPSGRLGKSAHTPWYEFSKLYREHREWANWRLRASAPQAQVAGPLPWPAATLDVVWRYRLGVQPDPSNVWGRVAAYLDGVQDAGLIADDRTVTTGTVAFERVGKGCEGVLLVFTRVLAAPPAAALSEQETT